MKQPRMSIRPSAKKRPRRLRGVVAVLAVAVLTFSGLPTPDLAGADPGDAVVFADPDLQATVNAALGQSPGDTVTEAQAATITGLGFAGPNIDDLGGIEYLTNLTSLNLSVNQISDVSALGSLTNLTDLSLGDNQVSDVTALGSLTNLTGLNLGYNQISDVSALGGLTNLTELILDHNPISDVTALGSLTNLTDLLMRGTPTSDVTALGSLTNLTSLYLGDNQISDVTALGSLTNLTGLDLSRNQISDVTALGGLAGLTSLGLRENQISNVSVLGNLTNLTDLTLSGNQISDVSALGSLTNLTDTNLALYGQSVTVPSAGVGDASPNPVVDPTGAPVVVASTDSGFVFDSGMNTWSFPGPGTKQLTWNTRVTIGGADAEFSGTITQNIDENPEPIEVIPQAPEVTQASCADGEVVAPQVALATTDGLVYTISGDVEPGATVTVTAELDGDAEFIVDPSGDWDVDSDHISATLQITLDSADCDTPTTTTPTTVPESSTTVPPVTVGSTETSPAPSANPAAPVSAQPRYAG